MQKQSSQVFSILIVLFLSYLGFSMALPIFPSLFLSENPHPIVPQTLTIETRTLILGFLIATYPIGQFFGGPFLGKLSDSYGRKKILVYSLILTIPTYIASGLAIFYANLPLLFVSRFFCGLFEGNSVIVSAALADISDNTQTKIHNFGLSLGVGSLGFVLGPYFGGKLSAHHYSHLLSYQTPFLAAAALVFIGLIFVLFLFKETLSLTNAKPFALLESIKTLFSALFHSKYRQIFTSNFLLYASFFLFFSFFPVLLVCWDGYSSDRVGEIISYLSIPICLSPLLYKYISKYLRPKTAIIYAALLFAICLVLLILFPRSFYFLLIPTGFGIAVSWTYTSVIISDKAKANEQGFILGANQAIMILSEIFASITGGLVAGLRLELPLVLSSLSALFGALCLKLFVRHDYKN